MTRWLCLLFFFFAVTAIYAQDDLQLSVEKLQEYKFKNWDSVEYYGNDILKLANQNQHYEKGLAYKFLGDVQWSKYSNFDSALLLYDEAFLHYNILQDSSLLATLYNNYGVVNKSKANYAQSIEYFSKALAFNPASSTSGFSVGILLNNIGEVSFFMGNLEEAKKYHLLASELALKKNDSSLMATAYFNLGNVASANNESQKAIDYFSKSLDYRSQDAEISPNTIMAIGREYHLQGELKKAIPYYREAIQLATNFKSQGSLALLYLSLGEAILTLDEPDTANNINKAIEIATELKQKRILLHAHEFLAWYFEAHNQPKLALEHFRKHKVYNDSILNENSLSVLNSLNVKFNTAQKEKQIANQELEIEQKNIAIIEERNQRIVIVTGLVFILLIGGIFYLRSRMQEKARLQQAIIHEKEKGLRAVFIATETERQRISKDLHDGVGQQLSGVKMQLESLALKDAALQEQKERITENLAQASQEVRQISHQMMPRSLEEEGLIPTLEDLFEKTFSGTSINCSFEHHKAQQRYPKEVELSLYRITQELINNIIKHANANNVTVQLYKIKSKLIMTIEDDGRGFDVESTSSGHGLLNIKSRIETVNGRVEYESSSTSETVITLSIPIA